MNNPLGVSLVKGIREPHEVKKKSFDLGGNQTHGRVTVDLIRRFVFLVLRGTTFICTITIFVLHFCTSHSKSNILAKVGFPGYVEI